MDPYSLIRFIVEKGAQDAQCVQAVTLALCYGVSPFKPLQDNKTLFEISLEVGNHTCAFLFITKWALFPNWNLHHEVYRLQEKKDNFNLMFVEAAVSRYKDQNHIVNHLLNILHPALIR